MILYVTIHCDTGDASLSCSLWYLCIHVLVSFCISLIFVVCYFVNRMCPTLLVFLTFSSYHVMSYIIELNGKEQWKQFVPEIGLCQLWVWNLILLIMSDVPISGCCSHIGINLPIAFLLLRMRWVGSGPLDDIYSLGWSKAQASRHKGVQPAPNMFWAAHRLSRPAYYITSPDKLLEFSKSNTYFWLFSGIYLEKVYHSPIGVDAAARPCYGSSSSQEMAHHLLSWWLHALEDSELSIFSDCMLNCYGSSSIHCTIFVWMAKHCSGVHLVFHPGNINVIMNSYSCNKM